MGRGVGRSDSSEVDILKWGKGMTICSIKKRKTFFTQTLFSEWIIELDHQECGWRGGSKSDETSL
jgi:hypothetical protein